MATTGLLWFIIWDIIPNQPPPAEKDHEQSQRLRLGRREISTAYLETCLMHDYAPDWLSRIFTKYLRVNALKSSPGSRSPGSLRGLYNLHHEVLKGLPFETILLNGRMRPENVLKG